MPFRLFAWRLFAAKRRNGTIQPPYIGKKNRSKQNSAIPDKTAPTDQGLHHIPLYLLLLNALLHCKPNCSIFRTITVIVSGLPIFRILGNY